MSSIKNSLGKLKPQHFIPLLLGFVIATIVAYFVLDKAKPIKFIAASITMVIGGYVITYRNYSLTRTVLDDLPIIYLHKRYSDLKKRFSMPNTLWHTLVLFSCGLTGYGFVWSNNIALICAAAIWWISDSGLNRNYEVSLLEVRIGADALNIIKP